MSDEAKMGPKVTRRTLLLAGCSSILSRQSLAQGLAEDSKHTPSSLRVSAVQFRSGSDLDENVHRHCCYIRRLAEQGSRIIVFPECSVTGYSDNAVSKCTAEDLAEAESRIAKTTKETGVYALVGIPTKIKDKIFNSAIVVDPQGKIIERYHKVQLAGERWAEPGDHLSVFSIYGIPCSIIICHDERYPELVRLPVLAGARIVFYISHESGMKHEHKIEPYRAQIVARAVENTVYVVQANAPAEKTTLEGSHGQSRIIAPSGTIICEASIYEEEVVSADLEMDKATGALAKNSLRCKFLKDWWNQGAAKVRVVE